MKYFAYILYSETLDRYYTGMSQFSSKRQRQHLKGQSKWTSQADDWVEIWRQEFASRQSARVMEKKIKSRGAARFLNDLGSEVPPAAG